MGLLNRISIIFTRRGLNLESVSSSASSVHGIHKMNFTCNSDRETMEKVISPIERCIDVLRAFLYTDDEIVYQEVALYKVPTRNFSMRKISSASSACTTPAFSNSPASTPYSKKRATRARPGPLRAACQIRHPAVHPFGPNLHHQVAHRTLHPLSRRAGSARQGPV